MVQDNTTTSTMVTDEDTRFFSRLSKVNISNFVSTKLGQTNYKQWKRQFLCLLESQELDGFVDGTLMPPSLSAAASSISHQSAEQNGLRKRKKTDGFVKGWILGSLSDDVLETCADKHTAREVWQHLENLFGPKPGAQPVARARERPDYNDYLQLYIASLRGDWESAITFLNTRNESGTAHLNRFKSTALHIAVAVKTDKGNHFVGSLVDRLTVEELGRKDRSGATALHYAATYRNIPAAIILVRKDNNLPHIAFPHPNKNDVNIYPVHQAAAYGYKSKDVYDHFKSVTTDRAAYTGNTGFELLLRLIYSELYDCAGELVREYPDLATHQSNGKCALEELAKRKFTFRSGIELNWLQRIVYCCASSTSRTRRERQNANDLENQSCCLTGICSFDSTKDKKKLHFSAIQLAETLCEKMGNLNDRLIESMVGRALLEAASCGTYELVELIVERFPSMVYYYSDGSYKNIFHIAIENRCEKVFNLIYRMNQHRHHLLVSTDNRGNTMLHFAAKIASPETLNLVQGPALQMQRELQWFQAVKKLVKPSYREFTNKNGEVAEELFTEEHRELKEAGEKWMKETATSLTITAALIATIAFAAGITVPGGSQSDNSDQSLSKGLPVFLRKRGFVIFFISNALSLFCSTTSLLLFVSFFTCHYTQAKFLRDLPCRLISGLCFLLLSITSLMISFGSTVFLVFDYKKRWVPIAVAAMAILPIIVFLALQLRLLVTLIWNTWGSGIFNNKCNGCWCYIFRSKFGRCCCCILGNKCESCREDRTFYQGGDYYAKLLVRHGLSVPNSNTV